MKEEILTKIEAVDKKVESLTTMVKFIKKEQNGQKDELKNKISQNEKQEILKKIDDLQNVTLKLLFSLLSGTVSLIIAMVMLILKGGV
jgi:predicted PurR-regulated permease PerM